MPDGWKVEATYLFGGVAKCDCRANEDATLGDGRMVMSKNYQQTLDRKGVPLDGLGVREAALTREDALCAIDFLEGDRIPILGGDVYFRRGSKIEPAYDNWHSDPVPGEAQAEYLSRGWKMSRDYVKGFPEREGIEPLFVLVVGNVV